MSTEAFRAIPLQVHGVLAGVPLHDVTVTELAGGGPGRTVADVRALFSARSGSSVGRATRTLFAFRKALGKLFGWDKIYMALIEPFRRFVVYPSLLRSVSRAWSQRYPAS